MHRVPTHEAEIGNFDQVAATEKTVPRSQIHMNKALVAEVVHARRNLHSEFQLFNKRQRRALLLGRTQDSTQVTKLL